MNEKYVAFIDILGFKKYISEHTVEEGIDYVYKFQEVVYDEWKANKNDLKNFNALLVSDSVIVSGLNLKTMIKYLIGLSQRGFEKHFLLRIGLAKGDFEKLPIIEGFRNLEKKLIVGNGYINAYLNEESTKVIGIIFDNKIRDEIENNYYNNRSIQSLNEKNIILSIDYDFLIKNDNLCVYREFASESKWLEHYHNTLWLISGKNKDKLSELICKMKLSKESEFYKIRGKKCDDSYKKIINNYKKLL